MPAELPVEIDCQTAAKSFQNNEIVLVDCREPEEFAIVQIPGSLLLPMSELATRAAELNPYKSRPVVVMCHKGMRSLRVTRFLRDLGFNQAQSLAGGIDRWAVEVDPQLPRY